MSRHGDCKVYVGDLGNNASKPELEDAFSYYGPLRNVWVARNPPGFAFVEFEDARDAEDAVSFFENMPSLYNYNIFYINRIYNPLNKNSAAVHPRFENQNQPRWTVASWAVGRDAQPRCVMYWQFI